MKKLLAVLPVIALLTACNATPIAKPNPLQIHQVLENTTTYKCDKSTEVVAIYGKDAANLKVTSPSLSLNQTALLLPQTTTASGMRYMVTSPDKTTTYDWGVKGSDAALTVTHNGTAYNFVCQAI